MDGITIDGMHEDAFRRSIEDMLRHGEADEAARWLRRLIEPYVGEGKALPRRFLSISAQDIALSGWGDLEASVTRYDRPDNEVSAVSLMIGEPQGSQARPDEMGLLAPVLETSYYSDEAFPFSEAERGDLLDGYSTYGCQWSGDCEGIDHAIAIEGADEVYGALISLEHRLLSTEEPGEDDIRAGTLGACYLSVLIHQSVRETIRRQGLPRPLCVMSGSTTVYPCFDAPVMTSGEYLMKGEIERIAMPSPGAAQGIDETAAPPARKEPGEEASLLDIGLRRPAKKPVLSIDAAEMAASMERLGRAQMAGSNILPPEDESTVSPEDYAEAAEADIFADPHVFAEAASQSAPPAEPVDALDLAGLEAQDDPQTHPEPASLSAPEPEPDARPGFDLWEEPAAEPETELAEAAPATDQTADHALDHQAELACAEPDIQVEPSGEAQEPAYEPIEWTFPTEFGKAEVAVPTGPVLAPGQDPETRGHSLRARLSDPAPDMELYGRESLIARISAWLKGLLSR